MYQKVHEKSKGFKSKNKNNFQYRNVKSSLFIKYVNPIHNLPFFYMCVATSFSQLRKRNILLYGKASLYIICIFFCFNMNTIKGFSLERKERVALGLLWTNESRQQTKTQNNETEQRSDEEITSHLMQRGKKWMHYAMIINNIIKILIGTTQLIKPKNSFAENFTRTHTHTCIHIIHTLVDTIHFRLTKRSHCDDSHYATTQCEKGETQSRIILNNGPCRHCRHPDVDIMQMFSRGMKHELNAYKYESNISIEWRFLYGGRLLKNDTT